MESKAWNILNSDEKSALSLSVNHDKSSWQAGEIMEKSHYKYLEIHSRARHFFKMFTNYFKQTNNLLIPEGTKIPEDFREFLHFTIEDRMKYREATRKIGIESPLSNRDSKIRTDALIKYLNMLLESGDPKQLALYDLIFDFDRWNNFRILPEAIQEPSAFKRRNKARLLKHLKNLKRIDRYQVTRFTGKFSFRRPGLKFFLPIVSNLFEEGYKVIPIKRDKALVEYFSKTFKMYIFKDEDEAIEYGKLVSGYLNLDNKNCKQGQQFWAKFRRLLSKSHNYDIVNNIIPRRRNLDNAFREIDFKGKRVKKKIHKNKWEI